MARGSDRSALDLYRQAHLAVARQAWAEARALIRQALALAPQQPEFHYALANILIDSGEPAAARAALEQAVRLRPTFYEAWNNLGLLLEDLGAPEAAEQAFAQALLARPAAVGARLNLARRYRLIGRHDETLAVCEAGLQHAPDEPSLLREKIAALILLSRCREAEGLLTALGMAETCWRDLWHRLAQRCAATNATGAARKIYRTLAASRDADWLARLGAALTLPVLPASTAALDVARAEYRAGLGALLEAATPENLASVPAKARFAATERDNFFLAYHGQVDLDVQRQYGELLRRLLSTLQQDIGGMPGPAREGPPRIGFVSAFIRDCTVGHYFRSWIVGLAEAGFAVTVFSLDRRDDALTREIAAYGVPFVALNGDLEARARILAEAAPDALIYPEIGMHGATQALAALRLAPVQCAAWGHPIGSGLSSIDVCFSSALMEPDGAAAHYSETLLCLPGLGTAYRAPENPPPADRAALGLPPGPLLFYPHSLFKTHPEDDALLAAVLRASPASSAILFASEYPEVTQAYRARLAAAGIAPARLEFLPLMPRQRYLQVARCCQAMLDCRYWSGGNTSLDAFSVGLPVATRPGATMRSRQSAGMLRAMEIEELIAGTESGLLEITARLLDDTAWQAAVSGRIVERRGRLFDDPAPVRALVAALESLLEPPELPIARSGTDLRRVPAWPNGH